MKTAKLLRRFSPPSVIQDRVVQRAFGQLMHRSHTVTCKKCGRDLKHEPDLLRLRLHGCPACGCRRFLSDARPETAPQPEEACG
jgi:DNA-directed RNA polymerase subunit RPC12/RpoP